MKRPGKPAASLADDKHPFLIGLGKRVHALRTHRGLTRKALSAAAQVSERHLANLEYGVGNASVLVLLQVAQALRCTVAELLADETSARAGRVALVGLRGAGKSTLGARLAEDLGFPFVELSREIEKIAGCPTGELQALYGPGAYRRYERRALDEALTHPQVVIATPGGLVSEAASFDQLLSRCTTVWLQADPEDHMQRVADQGDMRPMAGNREAMRDLKGILADRSAQYARAGIHVNTSAARLKETFAVLRMRVRQALALPGS